MGTQLLILIHITGGGVGLVSGAVALWAAKGGGVHRRSGVVFVAAMLAMALPGAIVATMRAQEINVVAALLTSYLVLTALTTLHPAAGRRLDGALMVLALALGAVSVPMAVDSMVDGAGHFDGIPSPMLLVFGCVALLGGVSDLRMIRAGGIRGSRRLARHLWRMCFALWIASASFFLGQADELPAALRITPLLVALAFLPLVLMAYWLWRVGRTRPAWRTVRVREPDPAAAALVGVRPAD